MKNILKFSKYVKPYIKNLIWFGVFTLITTLLSIFSLTLVIPFLQIIFDKAVIPITKPELSFNIDSFTKLAYYSIGKYITNGDKMTMLIVLATGLVIIFFLKNLSTYLGFHFLTPMRTGIIYDLRKKSFEKLTQLPSSYFTDARKGDILTRLSADIVEIEWSVVASFTSLIKEPLMIIATIIMLAVISFKLTLFVMIFLPITAFIISKLVRSLKKASFEGQKYLSDLIVILEESLGGMKIIQSFTAEQIVKEKFDEKNSEFVKKGGIIFKKRSMSSPFSEFLGSIVIAIVICFGGSLVLKEQLTAELFITYVAMFSQIISPAKGFSNAFYSASTGAVLLDRIEEIIHEPVIIRDKSTTIEKKSFSNTIEYKNISFQYGENPVIKNLSLKIHKGEMIALVGQSGAGKSTLVDLLSRFYDVNEGEICIDEQNIQSISLNSLRQLIGIVPQQSVLFNDTVAANIAFGDPNIDMEKVKIAAKNANAEEFILQLENKYDTLLGENGNKLSGGQKQRIAIARAIYKNPEILILDEATSSLDNESEKLVQDALQVLMKNRTSIVIAHRLSTIQNASKIIFMEEGKIKEIGTHSELISQNGSYKKLYEMTNIN